MFRILILLCVLAAGFVIGVRYERQQMITECANGEGEWTGTICVNSELLQ